MHEFQSIPTQTVHMAAHITEADARATRGQRHALWAAAMGAGILLLCAGFIRFDAHLSAWHASAREDAVVYRLETGLFSRMSGPRRAQSQGRGACSR